MKNTISNLKFRGMSYSFQSSQFGSIAKKYWISSSLAILLKNTRHFSSFFRLLDDNHDINFIDNKPRAAGPRLPARGGAPIVKYDNADIDKVKILKENKGKSGVYLWTNLINGKSYIGSSVNLRGRFYVYYSLRLLAKSNRPIDRAKYGFANFSLEILEFCGTEELLKREQHYLEILKPQYNILEIAGSILGYKHTEETLAKLRACRHSEESKIKISEARKGRFSGKANPM